MALLVEHGGAGPTVAAPIALQIIRDYERITAQRAGKPGPPAKASRTVTSPNAPALLASPPLGPQ